MREINEKNYKDAMDTLHAPAELVEKTKKLAAEQDSFAEIQAAKKNRRKRYRRIAAAIGTAAAVFCLAMTASHDSFAKYVKNIFHGFWGDKKEVSSYVQTSGIFEDEDEHVKVSVEELLSDEVYVSVVLKYRAKDEKGKEWLSKDGMLVGVKTFERSLGICPKEYGSPGAGATELEEYRTDSVRYFVLEYDVNDWLKSKKWVMRYSLTEHVRETELYISANVPVYEYALKAEDGKKLSKFYEPKVLRLSKLTMNVYGKDTGMSVTFRDEKRENSWLTDEFLATGEKENITFIQLIKNDGTYIPLSDLGVVGPGGCSRDAEEKYQCDCLVTNRSLYVGYDLVWDKAYTHNWLEPKREIQIDPEEIAGLSLSKKGRNVVYRLEELQ